MSRNPLYLVIIPNPHLSFESQAAVLQLRTNLDPLESYRFTRETGGFLMLKVPEPIIEIATGHRHDLYGIAQKLFGARWGAWTYLDDHTESYQIQSDTELRPQLTRREIRIMQALAETPNLTIDEVDAKISEAVNEKNAVASALRFLYENGFVIIDTFGKENRYSVRRG